MNPPFPGKYKANGSPAEVMEDTSEPDDEAGIGADCPACDDVTGHDILKEQAKGSGTDYLVRCLTCSKVHTIQVRPPRAVEIPFMLSEGPTTELVNIDIDADERLSIGDFFEQAEAMWEINRIEDKENQSKKSLLASNISRVNATRADVLRVRLTLTKGGVSISSHVNVPRDTTFQGGTLYDFAGETWRIRAIHTGEGRTMKGTVAAQNIKRVYLHEVKREEKPRQPRTEKERRQAWKEGRLGYNPNPIKTDVKDKPEPKPSRRNTQRKKKKRT